MDDPIDNAAFAHPSMVRDLVRLLPGELTRDLDLRTLRRLPSANVGKGAKRSLANMPLSLGFRPSAGRPPQARLPCQPELHYLVLDGEPLGEQDSGRGRRGNWALALDLLEEPMGLATRFDEWEAEFLQEGRKAGLDEFLDQVRQTNGEFG